MTIDRLKQIISWQVPVDTNTITPETTWDELGADSLDKIEMLMQIEEAFSIEIDDEDAEKMLTVGDVLAYLAGRQL